MQRTECGQLTSCCRPAAVPAHSQAQQGANPVKLLVAGFAAAAFMHGAMPAPAQAGVIMVKTGTKKVSVRSLF